jgi:hypothetical protein
MTGKPNGRLTKREASILKAVKDRIDNHARGTKQELHFPAPVNHIEVPAPIVRNEVPVPVVNVDLTANTDAMNHLAEMIGQMTHAFVEAHMEMCEMFRDALSRPANVTVTMPDHPVPVNTVEVNVPQDAIQVQPAQVTLQMPPRESRKFVIKHEDGSTSEIQES